MNYFDPNYVFENEFGKRVFGEERRKMEKVIQEDIPFDLSAHNVVHLDLIKIRTHNISSDRH
jgi:hypothetical protein